MPSVSIAVTTFRRPEYLAESLRSVLAQTHDDWEATVYDNAADPATEAVVRGLGDERITYVRRHRDLGVVENALDGLARCRGDFVLKLDDDDLLDATCLEELLAPFEGHPEVTLSASDYAIIDEHGALQPQALAQVSAWTSRDRTAPGYYRPFTALAARGTVLLISALFRRSAVDWAAVDRRCGPSYDVHLALLAAQDAATAHWSPRQLASYRVHSGMDTASHPLPQLEGAVFAREAAIASGRHVDLEVLRDTLASTGVQLARALLQEGRPSQARRVLARTGAVGLNPEALRLLALSGVPGALASRITRRPGRETGAILDAG